MQKKITTLLIAGLFLPISFAFAYDRQAAVNYAGLWWNTDIDSNTKVDHINSSLATPTAGPYTFYYKMGTDIFHDDGYNTVSTTSGVDCANFVSQCLIAGGLKTPMTNDENYKGLGGTIVKADKLGEYLNEYGSVTTIDKTSAAKPRYNYSELPSEFEPGDVVIFNNIHAVFATSGKKENMYFAAHTNDRIDFNIDNYLNHFTQAMIYHLEPFIVKIDPPFTSIHPGETQNHKVIITNKTIPADAVFTVHITSVSSEGWNTNIQNLDGQTFTLAPGASKEFYFFVTRKDALDYFTATVKVTVNGIDKEGNAFDWATEDHVRDHPDENYSISSPQYPTPWLVDTKSNIGILLSGNGDALGHLLGKYNIQTAVVSPTLEIINEPGRTLNDLKVLMIGSAGLSGNTSQIFKQKLEQFVSNGGVILCLTQPLGRDFAALPGNIEGYGWSEDQACFSNAVYINDGSPLFAGQAQSVINSSIDGYFTKYPDNAKVLLKRTKNQMPALLEYPYGSGKVIAGTMFSDWGYGHGQCSTEEGALVRDIVNYAKDIKTPINEYYASGQVNESVVIQLPYDESGAPLAQKAVINVYSPSGALVNSVEQNVPQTGESASINLSGAAPAQLGICDYKYLLKDTAGNIVQSETCAGRIGVKTDITVGGYKPGDFQIWANIPSENVGWNDEVTYTIFVNNNTGEDFVNGTIGVGGHEQGGNWWIFYSSITSINVPAHSQASFTYSRRVPFPTSTYFGLYKQGAAIDPSDGESAFFTNAIISCEKGVWLTIPKIDIAMSADKTEYMPGETVKIPLEISNTTIPADNMVLTIKAAASGGSEVLISSGIIDIPLGKLNREIQYRLQENLPAGSYAINASVSRENTILANSSAFFSIPYPKIETGLKIDEQLHAGMNRISIGLENTSDIYVADFGADVYMFNPAGNEIFRGTASGTDLPGRGQKYLAFDVPINNLAAGNYFMTYVLRYGPYSFNGKYDFPCDVLYELAFDKNAYKESGTINAALKLTNRGMFLIDHSTLTVTIPAVNYANQWDISLSSSCVLTLPVSLNLPADVQPGTHDVNIDMCNYGVIYPTMTYHDARKYNFTVPEAFVEYSIDNLTLNAGGSASITLRNAGGVTGTFDYVLTVEDHTGNKLVEMSNSLSLVSEQSAQIQFSVPNGITDGSYALNLRIKNRNTGKEQVCTKYLQVVNGLAAEINLGTDKTVYKTNEEISASAGINANQDTSGSVLKMKVFSPLPGWKNFTNTGKMNYACADGNDMWFAADNFIKKYDSVSGAWAEYNTPETNPNYKYDSIAKVVVTGDLVWSVYAYLINGGDPHDLCVFNKATGEWKNLTQRMPPGLPQHEYIDDIIPDGNTGWFVYEISRWERGLFKYDIPTDTFETITVPEDIFYNNFFPDKSINDGNILWFMSKNYGLVSYNKSTGQWAVKEYDPSFYVKDIIADDNSVWLLGETWNGGAAKYEPHFERYDKSSGQWSTVEIAGNWDLNDGTVYFVSSGNNIFWVNSGNIYRFDKNTLSNTLLSSDLSWSPTCMAINGKELWIGSQDNGAYCFNTETGVLSNYNIDNGLMSNSISFINTGAGSVWFGYSSNGLTKYTPSSMWANYFDNEIGGNVIDDISATDEEVWIGHDNIATEQGTFAGVSRYDYNTQKWSSHGFSTYQNGERRLAFDDNYVWVGSFEGPWAPIVRYDRSTGAYTDFYSDYFYLISNMCATGGSLWTMQGEFNTSTWEYFTRLCRYDKVTGERSVWNMPAGYNDPYYKISADANSVWIGSNESRMVYRFDIASESFQEYDLASMLAGSVITGICAEQDAVWAASETGLAKFDKAAGTWSKIDCSAIYGEIKCLNATISDVWAGADDGLYRYSKGNGEWSHFTTQDGLINNNVRTIASDDTYVWMGTEKGLSRLTYAGGTIWEKDVPLAGQGDINVSETLSHIPGAGKFYLTGRVTSARGQLLCESATSFYIIPGNVSVTLAQNKSVYKPGEQMYITCELKNMGLLQEDGTFALKHNGTGFYSTAVSLAPGESRSFTVPSTADQTFYLEGNLNDLKVVDIVNVETARVEMLVTGPETAGFEPFGMDVLLKNTGRVNADVYFDYDGEVSTITLAAGKTQLFSRNFQITKDTTYYFTLSGDAQKQMQKCVRFGLGANIELNPGQVYAEGIVDVPFKVRNTGILDLSGDITFELDGSTFTKSYSIPAGGEISDNIAFAGMTEGEHVLSYNSPLMSGTALLRVAKTYSMEITKLLPNTANTASTKIIDVDVRARNRGFNSLVGSLALDTGFYQDKTGFDLAPEAEKYHTFSVPSGPAAGTYDVNVKALCDGKTIAERTTPLTLSPDFAIVESTIAAAYNAGQEAAISVKVRNNGSGAGMCTLNVKAGDLLDLKASQWLEVGEEKVYSFSVILPADLEDKDYAGTIATFNEFNKNTKSMAFAFHVNGYKIGVSACLDKQVYEKGETARLTLDMSSLNGISPKAFAKLTSSVYSQSSQVYALGQATQTIAFDIPLPNDDFGSILVTYGVYLDSGRSMYINTAYVRQKAEQLSVCLDKDVYQAGDILKATVTADATGYLEISAHGDKRTLEIDTTGQYELSFNSPQNINSGTYYVDYKFTPALSPESAAAHRYPYDISGYFVSIKGCDLDKGLYYAGDDMKASLNIESNKNIDNVSLKGIVRSSKGDAECFVKAVSLYEGKNTIVVDGKVPAGLNEMVFLSYSLNAPVQGQDGLLLAGGKVSFDVRPPDITPPVIDIVSPSAGEKYTSAQGAAPITISYAVTDNTDSNPSVSAYLKDVAKGTTVQVVNGQQIAPKTIDGGFWTLTVDSVDWAGNRASTTTACFEVINDTRPPRTGLEISGPEYRIEGRTYVTAESTLKLSATDDLMLPGDSIGLGTARTYVSYELGVDSAASPPHWQDYAGPFSITTEGEYVVSYFSVDTTGNAESTNTFKVFVDTTPPASHLQNSGKLQGDGRTYVTSQSTFSIIADDPSCFTVHPSTVIPGSGLKEIVYRIDGGTGTIYAGTFNLNLQDGLHSLHYCTSDNLGNTGEEQTFKFTVDNTPPVVGIDPVEALTNTAVLKVSGVYNELNLDVITLNGGNVIIDTNTKTYSADVTLAEGLNNLTVKATDLAGNNGTAAASVTLYISSPVLTVPPDITAEATGVETPVFIGIATATSTYNVVITSDAPAAFRIGTTTVTWTAVDIVGNVSRGYQHVTIVDTSRPAIAIHSPLSDAKYIVGISTLTVVFSVTDADPATVVQSKIVQASGPGVIDVANGQTVDLRDLSAGYWELVVVAHDWSGNISSATSGAFEVQFDTTPPLTTIAVSGQLVALTAVDDISGVEKTLYRVDMGNWMQYTATVTVPVSTLDMDYYSVDLAGNEEQVRNYHFSINADTVPPTCQLKVTGYRVQVNGMTYLNDHSVFTITAVDLAGAVPASGVKLIQYRVDGGSWQPYAEPFHLNPADGAHTLYYRAEDNAGNVSAEYACAFMVDTTKPCVVETSPVDGGWMNAKKCRTVTIKISEPVVCSKWEAHVKIKEVDGCGKCRDIDERRCGRGKDFDVDYDTSTCTILITGRFETNSEYEITLKNGITDLVGNKLEPYTFSFRTFISAKEGCRYEDDKTGLIIVALPNTLPCDGYFEVSMVDNVCLPRIPRPFQWLFNGKKAYLILYRDEDGQIVEQEVKKAFKLVIILRNKWVAFAPSSSGGAQQQAELKNVKLYQVGAVHDAAKLSIGRMHAQGAPGIEDLSQGSIPKPMLVPSQAANDITQEVSADVSSFGLFTLAGFAAPSASLDDLSCYPSPFNPVSQPVTIQYYLISAGNVQMAIYDIMGNLVKAWEIPSGDSGAMQGLNQVLWDGKNGQGDIVANGGYIVCVNGDNKSKRFKMLVIK
ncbi:MAG: amidase domain-containing protein [Endomicrobiales bacterium]|nr:amidase domain-containing protein [Endomicrobiales bacterium]